MQIKLPVLYAYKLQDFIYGRYKPRFEACFVDLGGLEKHKLSTALLENSRKCRSTAWFSINSHKASPLGPVFELVVIVPS